MKVWSLQTPCLLWSPSLRLPCLPRQVCLLHGAAGNPDQLQLLRRKPDCAAHPAHGRTVSLERLVLAGAVASTVCLPLWWLLLHSLLASRVVPLLRI